MADPLDAFDAIFHAAGQEWNVDPLLLKALAKQESNGDPRAVSRAGAQGLMQIMPDTAKALGVRNPFDPVEAVFGAAKYMNEALDAEGTPEGALLYYHGGPRWREKFGPESRAYVPAIAKHYKALQAAQPPAQPPAAPAAVAAAQPPQEPR